MDLITYLLNLLKGLILFLQLLMGSPSMLFLFPAKLLAQLLT